MTRWSIRIRSRCRTFITRFRLVGGTENLFTLEQAKSQKPLQLRLVSSQKSFDLSLRIVRDRLPTGEDTSAQ